MRIQRLAMLHRMMCTLQALPDRAALQFLVKLQTLFALWVLTERALAACRWSGLCSVVTPSGTLCLLPASTALRSWHVSVLAGFPAFC